MVVGNVLALWDSGLEICVAIPFPDLIWVVEKIEQGLSDALGSLPAILAHLYERRPVPRSYGGKKNQTPNLKPPIRPDKPVEIGHSGVKAVAYALDAIERYLAHGGQSRHGRGLHVHQRGLVGAGQ